MTPEEIAEAIARPGVATHLAVHGQPDAAGKQMLRAAHTAGRDGIDFDTWYEAFWGSGDG